MKHYRPLILVILVLSTIGNVLAQRRIKQIDEVLSQYEVVGQFCGSVLVAERGKVIYKKAFGLADREWSIPNTADTKFRIASITKQFTAAVVLMLAEEGKIRLDGKVSEYLPDYRRDTGARVTIRHLLNHTSGIPPYQNVKFNEFDRIEFIKKFVSADLEFEPGTNYRYNNGGYSILGAIIERVTGKSYDKVISEKILQPLSMSDSGYDDQRALVERRARGYEKTVSGYRNAAFIDMSIPYAAGSLYSTVEDLFKWDQALFDGKLLSPKSKQLMITPGLGQYGFGVRISDWKIGKPGQVVRTIWHGGGINGFSSLTLRTIENHQSVVILDNGSHGKSVEKIANSILAILNGLEFEVPKKSIADELYKLALRADVGDVITEYYKLRSRDYTTYDFSEGELQTLGYYLIELKRPSDAVEIFKLNAKAFPTSAAVHESLGETYSLLGKKNLAIESYEKAIMIDPANSNAELAVKRLLGSRVIVNPATFDAFVGVYQVTPSLTLTIIREADTLFGRLTGQERVLMEPVSEDRFAMPEVKANIHFERDKTGKVIGLLLTQGTRSANAPKIR